MVNHWFNWFNYWIGFKEALILFGKPHVKNPVDLLFAFLRYSGDIIVFAQSVFLKYGGRDWGFIQSEGKAGGHPFVLLCFQPDTCGKGTQIYLVNFSCLKRTFQVKSRLSLGSVFRVSLFSVCAFERGLVLNGDNGVICKSLFENHLSREKPSFGAWGALHFWLPQ